MSIGNETAVQKKVLDACCGSRMMWLDRQHPNVIFGDRRCETLTVTDRSHGNKEGQRTLSIEPDVMLDFRALPYQDGAFKLVSFDPPHLVRAGPKSWLAAKYGKLGDDWRDDLRRGFAECFRVLAPDGVLVFKWNETQVKVARGSGADRCPSAVRAFERTKRAHALAGLHEIGGCLNIFEFMGAHPWLAAIITFAISETVVCVAKVVAIAVIRRRG